MDGLVGGGGGYIPSLGFEGKRREMEKEGEEGIGGGRDNVCE